MDARSEIPSSVSKRTNQVTPEATTTIAQYSTSEEDLDTVACSLNFQLIGD